MQAWKGNERADTLAKESALQNKKKPHYDNCPVSFVRRETRRRSIDEWDKIYQNSSVAKTTKLYFPDVVNTHKIVLSLTIDNITTQMLTGHGGFAAYLNRFKCKESPSCTCSLDKEETATHIIFDCPVYIRERYIASQKMDIDIKEQNANEIIRSKETRTIFIEFAKEIISKVNLRNK